MHIEYDDFGSYEETIEFEPVSEVAREATGR